MIGTPLGPVPVSRERTDLTRATALTNRRGARGHGKLVGFRFSGRDMPIINLGSCTERSVMTAVDCVSARERVGGLGLVQVLY